MAAPHVAGGWALIRQAAPAASVNTILAALRNTGRPVTDSRLFVARDHDGSPCSNFSALASIASVTSPSPSIASVTPTQLRTGAPATLTVLGSGFNALSVVRWNGVPKATTVRSAGSLEAVIPAADLAVGTALVSVFNPAPGGGIVATAGCRSTGPALKVSATTVGPGSGVTVTLEHGFGGAKDWIALASTAAGDELTCSGPMSGPV